MVVGKKRKQMRYSILFYLTIRCQRQILEISSDCRIRML